MSRFPIAAATLALVLTACAAGTPSQTDPPATSAPPTTTAPGTASPDLPASPGGGINGDLDETMIDEVVEQAAADTGVSADEISVATAEAVTWSDGSLGCPEPGMGYTQALVPGYRIVLDVDGEQIHYHAASDGDFFACENPQGPMDNR